MSHSCARLTVMQTGIREDVADKHLWRRRTMPVLAVAALMAFPALFGGCNLGGGEYSPNPVS